MKIARSSNSAASPTICASCVTKPTSSWAGRTCGCRKSISGLPVFGYQLIVHLDTQNQVVTVNGHFRPNLDLDTTPKVSQADAEQLALDDLLNGQLQPDQRSRVKATILRDQTQLMIHIDQNDQPRLTWYVTIMTDSPLGQWRYFVNARRAQIVHQFDSAAHDKRRITYTADNSTDIPGRLLIDEGERSKDAIAQAAHDGAGKVYDYYFNTFKRDGLDDQGSPLVSTVHYGSDPEDAENAAWIGEAKQMIYGDGGKIFKPLAYGLDVVGHEFTHGVIDNTSDLIYEGQSGALNESYADVFGALIDRGNWTIGETVIKSPPYPFKFLRSLEDPGAGGNYDTSDPLNSVGQPANMKEYADLPYTRKGDNGGVHVNSGIPNLVAYLIAKRHRAGEDRADLLSRVDAIPLAQLRFFRRGPRNHSRREGFVRQPRSECHQHRPAQGRPQHRRVIADHTAARPRQPRRARSSRCPAKKFRRAAPT